MLRTFTTCLFDLFIHFITLKHIESAPVYITHEMCYINKCGLTYHSSQTLAWYSMFWTAK